MIKSLIKEVFIILLLIIAILLVLGVLFYEYRPSTKKIPTAVKEYSLPEEMQEELNETIEKAETQNIVLTYRINSQDLAGYEKTNDYEKGKVNPFEKATVITENNSSEQNNTVSGGNTNQTTQDGTNGSQGNFLNIIK